LDWNIRSLKYRSGANDWYQVDADFVNTFVSSFLDHLKLSKAYNVFVLNPKKAAIPDPYGYRIGLSPADLKVLQEVSPLLFLYDLLTSVQNLADLLLMWIRS
jgi:hypothetical protein